MDTVFNPLTVIVCVQRLALILLWAITDENFYENNEITDITTVNLEDFNSSLLSFKAQ